MNNMPKGQQRAAVILGLAVILVFLVILAILDLSAFFIVLILLVLGICFLRMKKPEYFSIFAREKKQTDTPLTRTIGRKTPKCIFGAYHPAVSGRHDDTTDFGGPGRVYDRPQPELQLCSFRQHGYQPGSCHHPVQRGTRIQHDYGQQQFPRDESERREPGSRRTADAA